MATAIPSSTTLTLADDLAQPNRLCVARSQVFALARNGAEEPELMHALPSISADALKSAYRGILVESQTVHDLSNEQQAALLTEIASFVAITGGGWPPEQRAEFIQQAAANLADIPVRLLAPAIRDARKRVWEPKRFVSWIHESVAADMRRLSEELAVYDRIIAAMNNHPRSETAVAE